jgi:hypothetical protein
MLKPGKPPASAGGAVTFAFASGIFAATLLFVLINGIPHR